MAKQNRISYMEDQQINQPQANYAQYLAATNAPPMSTTPRQVTTGQEQKQNIMNSPVGDAVNQKLTQAQAMDKAAGFNGFNVRRQALLDKLNSLQPSLPQYVPGNTKMDSSAFQAQTRDLGGGSTLMNPSDAVQAQEWNVAKLKQLHPDWTADMLNQYMNQRFNYQAYNDLVAQGAIQPNQASRDWTAHLAEVARLKEQARQQAALAAQQASYGGGYGYSSDDSGYYSNDGGYSGGGSGGGGDDYNYYTPDEAEARRAAENYGVPSDDNSYYENTGTYPSPVGDGEPPQFGGWLSDAVDYLKDIGQYRNQIW